MVLDYHPVQLCAFPVRRNLLVDGAYRDRHSGPRFGWMPQGLLVFLSLMGEAWVRVKCRD